MTSSNGGSSDHHNARLRALIDIIIVLIAAFGVKAVFEPISWRFASVPGAIAGIVVATLLLRAQGQNWADVGLKGPKTFLGALGIPVLAIVAFVLAVGIGAGVAVLATLLLGEPPAAAAEARFGDLQGNLSQTALWILIGWLVGGFSEEMLFRGFLISRFEQFFRNDKAVDGFRWTLILSILLPAIIFGFAHYYYRGLHGALVISTIGIVLGGCYILFGRRLWPLIIAHGSVDTLGFIADYLDADW